MPTILLVTPFFTDFVIRTLQVTAALPGVRLGVISQQPQEDLAPDVRACIAAHWRADSVLDSGQLVHAAGQLAAQLGPIHRMFGPSEHIQVAVAEARERLGIRGLNVEAVKNFRDKAHMKDKLRAAGLPCARHRLVTTDAEAWAFVDSVGYPVVVKPPAGAAAQTTFRAAGPHEFRQALQAIAPDINRAALIEEFITGDEHSFDTFSVNGKAVWHSLTHYFPNPLEVMQTPWIQWCVLLPREIDAPQYDDIRGVAFRALEVLGMENGLSHLEWFRRRDGSMVISEVGARPPGAQFTTLISRAHDFDCVAAWARLMVFGEFTPPPARLYAAGAAYLRGQGQGRVRAVHGWEQAERELGHLFTDVKLPTPGQAPSGTYEGEGYVILRHLETSMVKEALFRLVSLVRVELG
jgi:biotin carboxylase